ncbi:MAG: hypothetical protein R3C28_04370 [Pirellulaceae bacterium]
MTNSRTGDLSALGPDVFRLVEQLTDLLRDGKHAEFDELLAANPEHADALNSVLPSICLLNDFDGLAIVEAGTWREVVRGNSMSNFSPDALRFSPDGLSIVSGHSDSIIRIWDRQTLSLVGELKGHSRVVLRLAIHPDGKTLTSVSADSTARLWNIPTRTLLGTLNTFEQTPWDCRFSATGNQLAVMTRLDDDATCHVWRVLEAE